VKSNEWPCAENGTSKTATTDRWCTEGNSAATIWFQNAPEVYTFPFSTAA
jgi:hypothetical protein